MARYRKSLRVPSSALSGKSEAFVAVEVDAVAEEFHESMVRGAAREKFGQGVSQRHGGDLLGRRDPWSDGAEPRSEAGPDGCRGSDRQVLEQALGDQAELDVAVIGGDLSSDGGAVAVRFTMKILVA